MPPILRSILPFFIANIVLIVVALALLVTGHKVIGLALMVIDAGNIMVIRWKYFRWQREQRRR